MTTLPKADHQHHYGVASPHPEVVSLLPRLVEGEILDIGCGTGRHALYLQQHGFPVTAWDNDLEAVQRLKQINAQASLPGITVASHDLNHHRFNGQYHAIIAVDTLMYLDPATISQLIADMQAATCKGGYNLIVCAMHDEHQLSAVEFPFALSSGELSHYYRRWHIVHYHEQIETWLPPSSQAEPVTLRFATLLAQKISIKEL
ncbi:methyltransferase domain-containing protein [Rosenbergiella sp. S61]|uniref:Methyltransferase domain-containing protein n=1 Tax=Rosenbergiella gaditana TaxID=2726987 RepID=A0ABS5SV35_9GAMM|nr:methyltransferase domain-containing protein [Rosenbergiella gaditana]MBT0723869.1 methyltransferase domain-containing protein [Rosenbergiella gaditana]